MKSATLGLAACLAVGMSCACLAQELKATPKHSDTALGFDVGGGYSNFTLTVTGPNGFQASAASKDSAPSIDLRQAGARQDGAYIYKLTASTGVIDNGRPGAVSLLKPVSLSGQIHLKDGTIEKVDPNAREPEKVKRSERK